MYSSELAIAAFTSATGTFTSAKHTGASAQKAPLQRTTPSGPRRTAVVSMPTFLSSSTSWTASKVCLAALQAISPTAAGQTGGAESASGTKTSGKAYAALL